MQTDWEAEGKVPDMAGWVFRSRRMIRGMGHMLFPRYIQREQRDFFYLTARSILPGAPIAGGAPTEPDEGTWRTRGLPQHGFPYALATTWVHAGGLKLRVVRADPRTMKPQGVADAEPVVLALEAAAKGDVSLWWASGVFSISVSAPIKGATRLAGGYPATTAAAATARAAVGVQDEDGMLVWVELPPEAKPDARTAAAMDDLLERLGCSTRMAVTGEARALLGGSLDVTGAPVAPPAGMTRLVRTRAPDAHPFADKTPLVDIEVWRPLQAKRIRYFYKPTPTPSASPSASPSPSPAPSPAPGTPAGSAIRVQSPR
jgi:hypothetical protein